MGAKDKLIIHKLKINLEVGDKDAFKHFGNRVSALCRRLLPEKLDTVLKKYDLPDGKLVINKMTLNLGTISPLRFEKTIVDSITKEFDEFLKKNIKELDEEIKQSKFKKQSTSKIVITHSNFSFESSFSVPQSVLIDEERQISIEKEISTDLIKAISQKNLPEATFTYLKDIDLSEESTVSVPIKTKTKYEEKAKAKEKETEIPDTQIYKPITKTEILAKEDVKNVGYLPPESLPEAKYSKLELKTIEILRTLPKLSPAKQLQAIQEIEVVPIDLPPKKMTPLEQAFIYYIVYGWLPSNVKYELGMKMSEIFDINQKDIRFFNDIRQRIRYNQKAKERLIRLSDTSNKESLIKKDIISLKETEDFDLKTPPSFADYFVALALDFDTNAFTPLMQRYNLNDMIRFFYADHPQKLKSIVEFLVLKYPSDMGTRERLENLFSKIGKGSIVKIFASFARKAGTLNKALNQLNRANQRDLKSAHTIAMLALLQNKNPMKLLEAEGFQIEEEIKIESRVFLKNEESFDLKEYSKVELVDYYLRYGSLPYSTSTIQFSITRLDAIIQTLNAQEIQSLNYFKDSISQARSNFEGIGELSYKAILYLLKVLRPNLVDELSTKYEYFKHNLKGGVPRKFQNAFLLHYALKNPPKSYLEEMLNYWKSQFGDDDKIIKKRWKVSEELAKQFNQLIYIKEEPLEDLIKVDSEFQSYSKDISIKNAGLVILWPFLKIYFNMLDLLNEEGDFRSIKERARACHLLQYLAIERSYGEEFYYPLNKILTGYPLDEPLSYEITMTKKEIDVSNALLKNVIKQWNALKGSTVNGLRGSFLIRDGILVPSPNGWLLTVEAKAYDVLMHKLSWGIGMIKLSWAPYILNVEWERNIM